MSEVLRRDLVEIKRNQVCSSFGSFGEARWMMKWRADRGITETLMLPLDEVEARTGLPRQMVDGFIMRGLLSLYREKDGVREYIPAYDLAGVVLDNVKYETRQRLEAEWQAKMPQDAITIDPNQDPS